jgi:hypothetical protein
MSVSRGRVNPAAPGPITEVQQIELDSPKLPFNSEANTLNRYLLE